MLQTSSKESKRSKKYVLKGSKKSKPVSKPAKTQSTSSPESLIGNSEKWEKESSEKSRHTAAVPFEKIAADIKLQNQKRKRGRPRKLPSPSATDADSPSISTTIESEFGSPSETTQFQADAGLSASGGASPAPHIDSSGIPPEALRNSLQIPFAIAAANTGFEGFALSKEEADPLVPLLDHCIVQYLPNLMGPHATAWMLGGSILTLAGVKFMTYAAWKKERNKTPSQAAEAK